MPSGYDKSPDYDGPEPSPEVGDEEASSASVALTVLREVFGGDPFTARDVVKAMKLGLKSDHPTFDDPVQERADAIADTLDELSGKRFDRPTALSIGKLFQKRLVRRDLPLKFHPTAIRVSAGFAPVGAVSCSA